MELRIIGGLGMVQMADNDEVLQKYVTRRDIFQKCIKCYVRMIGVIAIGPSRPPRTICQECEFKKDGKK
jgi:hypothetical protein